MLDSISKLEPQPKEVIVVLPEGYSEPAEKLGWETFYWSKKGMVFQRQKGIESCRTEYALVCDDDVNFSPDFVQKLYEPLADGQYGFSAGPLYSFLPEKGIRSAVCILSASAVPTVFHRKDRYVSVLRSTGYSYNRHLKPGKLYETQSVAWTCFFCKVNAFLETDMMSEIWMEKQGYTAMDDQVQFYKAWLQGSKTAVVPEAVYEHMDGKTSTRNNKPAILYSLTFNRVVFWHRFIYSQASNVFPKAAAWIAFQHRMLWDRLRELASVARKRMTSRDYATSVQGYRDGWKYLKSEEYRSLPPIIVKQ